MEDNVIDIFQAAAAGDLKALADLLNSHRDSINSFSNEGWTPLHLAAHYGHLRAAQLLLEFGADPDLRSRNTLDNIPLHAAVAGNHLELVKLLLVREININSRQHGGWTALHGASQNGNLEMVRYLIAHGAEINLANDNGITALNLAISGNHLEIIDYLKNNGAK